jgi:hypothetical protein
MYWFAVDFSVIMYLLQSHLLDSNTYRFEKHVVWMKGVTKFRWRRLE